ncbi:MAG: CBS domain-containing protein [Chloroflexi bacterium]|nr:CBS domain-containing protein [Chloroflexota bacterium]MCI0646326.1 CBS domain-containing protein [Chloroflexota bacterium]MCI0726976.1 CBS domain-containing protein [Chloroflexota bacterium]
MKISRILSTKSREVLTARPEQSLRDVVDLLVKHNIGALVVLDEEERLVGIISERDVIRRLASHADALSLTVDEVMTRRVIVGMPQDDVMSVANTMTEKRFRHLPILDKGRLVGIISIGDIIKAQRDAYRGEIDTLETQIMADQVSD